MSLSHIQIELSQAISRESRNQKRHVHKRSLPRIYGKQSTTTIPQIANQEKSHHGRHHPETNHVGQGIQFLAHFRLHVQQTSSETIKEIEYHRQNHEPGSKIQMPVKSGINGHRTGRNVHTGNQVRYVFLHDITFYDLNTKIVLFTIDKLHFYYFCCKFVLDMAKFLIIRFSSIGDIIQCMNVVNGIKNHFPDAEIHWIARKDMGSFLNMDKRIDRVWGYDKKTGFKGLLQMAHQLKAEKFDYIYDAHSNIRSNILKAVLLPPLYYLFPRGPRYTLRHKDRWKRFLLFKLRINKFDKPFRGIISYQKPLATWGITNFESDYSDWNFPAEYEERFHRTLTPKTITLVPSANWEMKRWPVSNWQQVIQLMPDYRFIILAGPSDTFCETIQAIAPERVNNLAGKTSLLESCYLVKQSNLVISGDTGFLHAADLFHTKAIALMGPTAFGYPTGKQVEVIEVDLPCRPCTKDGHGKCKQSIWQKCIVDILPKQVVNTALRILNLMD